MSIVARCEQWAVSRRCRQVGCATYNLHTVSMCVSRWFFLWCKLQYALLFDKQGGRGGGKSESVLKQSLYWDWGGARLIWRDYANLRLNAAMRAGPSAIARCW